ncbi:MAG TPA: NUDIX hydrolase [Candidatus Binataceae bacterium]|nr:NUDIX hydrolase [Candidatus Binataceae bacterium]
MVEREVQFKRGGASEIYHAVALADYVAILAVTADGRFPLVHQFRPAIEGFTWELPSGMVDADESPIETCRRELFEESGFAALTVHDLGTTWVDVGRLCNRLHAFFVVTGERAPDFVPEPGIAVSLATPGELVLSITSGRLAMQLHAGVILQAVLRGYLNPDLSRR